MGVAGVLALAAAFVAGVRVGSNESAYLLSTIQGSMLVGELRALRAGKSDNLIKMKELELDRQVLYYSRLQHQGHPWLLWPESQSIDYERHLRSIARYRTEYPSVLPTIEIAGPDDVREESRQIGAEVARTTQEIVQTYGK